MVGLAMTFAGDRGNYDRAMRLCRQALGEARIADETGLAAEALNAMGELARSLGDDEVAAQAYEDALHISREVGDEWLAPLVLCNLAFIAEHWGDHQTAEHVAAEVLKAGWKLDRLSLTARGLGVVAVAATAAGKAKRGARLLGDADRACEVIGITPTPADQPEYERAWAKLAQQLEPAELEALMAEGGTMTRPEAVTYALEERAT